MNLKVMTYNICSGHNLKYEYKLDETIEFIRSESPDILGLNEVNYNNKRGNFTNQCKTIADSLGYSYYYFGKAINFAGGEYGNALITRYPIVEIETVPVPELESSKRDRTYEPRSHIRALLDADGRRITVLVTHYGLSLDERKSAVSETVRLAEEADTPVLFMGDLNAQPDFDELKPVAETLRDTGTPDLLTFRSDVPAIKIDYIFASRDFETVKTYVPVTQASDHRPYVTVLSLD